MIPVSYHRSRPEGWHIPRWTSDACERRRIYGRVRPMQESHGLLGWLLGRGAH